MAIRLITDRKMRSAIWKNALQNRNLQTRPYTVAPLCGLIGRQHSPMFPQQEG